MRLFARTALAIACPALHCGLIDAECKFNEHAFINNAISERRAKVQRYFEPDASAPLDTAADAELALLEKVKDELTLDYQPLYTPRKT